VCIRSFKTGVLCLFFRVLSPRSPRSYLATHTQIQLQAPRGADVCIRMAESSWKFLCEWFTTTYSLKSTSGALLLPVAFILDKVWIRRLLCQTEALPFAPSVNPFQKMMANATKEAANTLPAHA
jgi:hypothetical protein